MGKSRMNSGKGILLIDLDGTLLVNPVEQFLKSYFQLVAQVFQNTNDPEIIIAGLMKATRAMNDNQSPDRTLEQVFNQVFYPAIGSTQEDLKNTIDVFFNGSFSTLKSLTAPMVGARQFIDNAVSEGFKLVIATNPLFPKTVIEQRLEWAGLPTSEYPFDLVTSSENFHFAKPSPAFFAEILAHLGWQEEPVTVIGDDLSKDVIPAMKLGINAFWTPTIENAQDYFPSLLDQGFSIDGSGSLEDAWQWLQTSPKAGKIPDFYSFDACLAILRSSPTSISRLIETINPDQWTQRPKPKEWSLVEIICHLRDVEIEINIPRLEDLLSKENPLITGIDSDVWAAKRNYLHQDPGKAWQDYIKARLRFLSLMDHLTPEDWQKPARHTIFGKTNFTEIMCISARHDRLHVRQFNATHRLLRTEIIK